MISLNSTNFNSNDNIFIKKIMKKITVSLLANFYSKILYIIIDNIERYFGSDYVIHGYYNRTIIYNGEKKIISVLRIRNKTTGRTHAVLPDFIVPYIQCTSPEVIRIITNEIINNDSCIIHKRIANVWNRSWKNRLLTISNNLLDILKDFHALCLECVKLFKLAFFQNHCGTFFFI